MLSSVLLCRTYRSTPAELQKAYLIFNYYPKHLLIFIILIIISNPFFIYDINFNLLFFLEKKSNIVGVYVIYFALCAGGNINHLLIYQR